ncbi:unnamed protein product [Caenorhabditis sp. 36 PRJEB53466]|nr:unnamed protein product [Caenorhabditis sp. 36 PRJEB53466]
MLRLVFVSACIASSSAFLFPMTGGGGGGCGCAPPPPPPCCPPPAPSCGCAPPPPPPPPSCGCGCGRKKRSAEEADAVEGVLDMDSSMECNSDELKQVLEQNMKSTPSDSLLSVRSSLPSDDHLVSCTHGLTAYSAPPGTTHCAVRKENHFCQIFSLHDH